jgi:hypothetical protein
MDTIEFKISRETTAEINAWKLALKQIYGEYGKLHYTFIPINNGFNIKVYSDIAHIEKIFMDEKNNKL